MTVAATRARGAPASLALPERPFYRERLGASGRVRPWSLGDLEDFALRTGDPFAGRVLAGATVPVALQVEATSEPPVWTAFDGRELDAWAAGLARIWASWGLERGETIAFFEYGSSPLVLLASASFVAYLGRGAADRLGVAAVCNDGVAAMAERMVSIVENVSPAALILRRDVLGPFAEALRTSGTVLRGRARWVAVTEPEGLPPRADVARFAAEAGVPVRRLLRADAAALVAGECEVCGLVHLDARLHRVERVEGSVALTARFARLCPTVAYDLGPGEIAGGSCERDPRATRVALA